MENLDGDVSQANDRAVLTKSELIRKVSSTADITLNDAEAVLEAILNSIVRTLRAGNKVEVRGFGSFRTRRRQARIARNPKTGARVEVPAKNVPYFTPSKDLKDGLAELAIRFPN